MNMIYDKYDSSLFFDQSCLFNDGAQSFLTFHMLYYTLRRMLITASYIMGS